MYAKLLNDKYIPKIFNQRNNNIIFFLLILL